MFQRRHYSAIASIIASAKDKDEVVKGLVNMFKHDNEWFSEERFKEACQFEPKVNIRKEV